MVTDSAPLISTERVETIPDTYWRPEGMSTILATLPFAPFTVITRTAPDISTGAQVIHWSSTEEVTSLSEREASRAEKTPSERL